MASARSGLTVGSRWRPSGAAGRVSIVASGRVRSAVSYGWPSRGGGTPGTSGKAEG